MTLPYLNIFYTKTHLIPFNQIDHYFQLLLFMAFLLLYSNLHEFRLIYMSKIHLCHAIRILKTFYYIIFYNWIHFSYSRFYFYGGKFTVCLYP